MCLFWFLFFFESFVSDTSVLVITYTYLRKLEKYCTTHSSCDLNTTIISLFVIWSRWVTGCDCVPQVCGCLQTIKNPDQNAKEDNAWAQWGSVAPWDHGAGKQRTLHLAYWDRRSRQGPSFCVYMYKQYVHTWMYCTFLIPCYYLVSQWNSYWNAWKTRHFKLHVT